MIVGMAIAAMSLMGNKAYAQFDFGKILQNGADILSNGGTTDDLLSGITSIFSDKKVATIDDLVGEWTYTEPAVVFMSENLLKKAGGKLASSAIEKTIETQLSKVGITKGAMKMTFTRNGRFTQTIAGQDADEIMMGLLEADVDVREVTQEGESVVVYGEPNDFHAIQSALEAMGISEFEVAELDLLPQNEVTLTGDDLAKFERLIEVLEDNDDVQRVYHNVDLED